MLAHEYRLLKQRLDDTRGKETQFLPIRILWQPAQALKTQSWLDGDSISN